MAGRGSGRAALRGVFKRCSIDLNEGLCIATHPVLGQQLRRSQSEKRQQQLAIGSQTREVRL